MAKTPHAKLSYGLEDAHAPLTPFNPRPELGDALDAQEPTSPRSFPSMQPGARVTLRSIQVRFSPATIQQLEKLRAEKGVVSCQFIRDAVEHALRQLGRGAQ
jgi:hypothetical protein